MVTTKIGQATGSHITIHVYDNGIKENTIIMPWKSAIDLVGQINAKIIDIAQKPYFYNEKLSQP